MRASMSMWSRYVNRLFGPARGRTRLRRTRRRAPEVLEGRTLLSVTFGSALSIGNDVGESAAADVATDQAGNSYVTGWFNGTVDFDPAATHDGGSDILTSLGSNDAFVAKYAPDNSLAWVKRMGGDVSDTGRKITLDGSGSMYVAGNFSSSSADFGPTILSSAGGTDGFVAKLDAGGTIEWAQRWGTAVQDLTQGVGADSAGNVYALSAQIVNGRYDLLTLKFSPTGTAVWSKSIAAQGGADIADLAVNASGNVFVVGQFRGTVDFDPGPARKNVSGTGSFVLKLDTDGKFGWVTPFLVQTADSVVSAHSVALDGSGNVIVGGSYNNSVDFDPGKGKTTLPTTGGGYITKLNSSGGLVWARAFEGGGQHFVRGVAVDAAGSIYATGDFSGAIDFDPGAGTDTHTSAGQTDVFVVKLDATGAFAWAATFGGTGSDGGRGIAVDPTGGVHIVGYYNGTVDFDPGPATYDLTNPGMFSNGFLLLLEQS